MRLKAGVKPEKSKTERNIKNILFYDIDKSKVDGKIVFSHT